MIEYGPGTKNVSDDHLSRISVQRRPVEDRFDEGDMTCAIVTAPHDNDLESQFADKLAYLLGKEITASSDSRRKARRDAKRFTV